MKLSKVVCMLALATRWGAGARRTKKYLICKTPKK